MFEALLGRLGLKLGKTAAVAIITGVLFVTAGGLFWWGMREIHTMTETARTEAREARDAHWRGEIARSNAEVEKARAEQAAAALGAEARATEEIAKLRASLEEVEKANAALPGGDRRALGRNRVRLLRNGSGTNGED